MTRTIQINAARVETSVNLLTYEHLVSMAGMTGNPKISWNRPDGKGGWLEPGASIVVHEGTIFLIGGRT